MRQLRFERGLTLSAVADAAGMAPSTLSRLENGTRRLTVDHLSRLADALDVRVQALLGPGAELGAQARPAAAHDGKRWWPIVDQATTPDHVFRVQIPAELSEPSLHSHEGHQWLHVLTGRLRLLLHRRDTVLQPGETAQFSTWSPHWLGAIDAPAELLVIFNPQGEPLRQGADWEA